MAINKHLLNHDDYQQYKNLFFYSFQDAPVATKIDFLKREFEKSQVYGIKDDDQLMASVTSIPFKVNFFGKIFKMAGIGNVMSAPEYLQSKGIDTLMKQAFNDMYQNKVTLSYLGPFSFDYYRRFGYEQVFEKLQIELPFEKLIRYPKPMMGHLRRFKYNQAQEVIGELFAAKNTAGTVVRNSWWWKNLSLWSPDDLLAVFYDETDVITGYLRYECVENDFIVRDMFYQTPDAFLGLMHFINKHRSIYQKIVIESSDINLRVNKFITNPLDATVTVKPSMMARIVRLKQFLIDYPMQVENLHTINIEVNDSLEWNSHVWQLSVKNHEVELGKADDEIPDVIVNIQTLTKALFGYQSLKDSFLIGDVLGDPDKISILDQAFIHERAQLKDTF